MSSADPRIVIEAGAVIGGRYRLDRMIGQGAAGTVWLGTHETIGRQVAVKFLRNEAKQTSAMRFLQEARLAAQVQNRFVVSIFDFGNLPSGTLYMVMEHLHGETLGGRVGRYPPLKVRQLLRLMAQALIGLECVHRAGIVHRDLKPENIFLVQEGGEVFPKLLDFGVSRSDSGNPLGPDLAKLTATGMTVGTPLFMSPEQARGYRDLDARADIYSMGVILFRALTGKAPFRENNVLDLLMAVVNSLQAPSMLERRPELGEALSAIVQKAMAPNRDQRYADAGELRRVLEEIIPSVPEDLECPVRELRTQEEKVKVEIDTIMPETDADPTMPRSMVDPVAMYGGRIRRRQRAVVAGGLVGLVGLLTGVFMLTDSTAPAMDPKTQQSQAAEGVARGERSEHEAIPAAVLPLPPSAPQKEPVLPVATPGLERLGNDVAALPPRRRIARAPRKSANSATQKRAPELFSKPDF